MLLRVLTLAPWRRGPALLLHRPGVAVALGAAAFVAALPAASAPLFLSSARSAALHHQMDNTCAANVAEHVTGIIGFRGNQGRDNGDLTAEQGRQEYEQRQATVERIAAGTTGLTAPVTSLRAVTAVRPVAGTLPRPSDDKVWLVGRSDRFADRLHVVQGPDGDGVWISDRLAAAQGIRVGAEFEPATLQLAPGMNAVPVDASAQPVRLRVAAIYTDLRSLPDDPYWCTLRDTYRGVPGQEYGDVPILPVVFADLPTFLRAATASARNYATESVDFELVNKRPTNPQAHVMASRIAALRGALDSSGAVISVYGRPGYISALAVNADRADLIRRTLVGTVVPAAVAGVLVGLVVVAAAAVFWVQRRRVELAVLAAHGVGPAALGVKAGTEALAALVTGGAAGLGAAWGLVVGIGPSRVLSGEAKPVALAATAACVLACLVLTMMVAGARARTFTDRVPPRRRLRPLAWPWELLALAAAVPLWSWLGDERERVDRPGGLGAVAHVPQRLVIVPILVFVAAVVVAARVGGWWLRRRAARPGPRRPALFLASRRLSRPAVVAAVLAGATAVPVALAGFGVTVTDSVRLTLRAKAQLTVGSDTVLTLEHAGEVPPELTGRATEVLRLDRVRVGELVVDVIGVDPATFARGAFWHPQIAGPDLRTLVADLHAGPEPNGIEYGALPRGPQPMQLFGATVAWFDVTRVPLLPGAKGGYPVLLVHRDALAALAEYVVPQLWVRGDSDSAFAAVASARLPVTRVQRTEDVYADSLYEPVTYTFQYLIALATFAGLVVLVGLLLYLEARSPGHRRGYVLLRRMGLTWRAHLAALFAEIALPLGAGLALGLALAAAMVWSARASFDLAPVAPPGVLVEVPGWLALALGVSVGVVAAAATLFAQRRVGRASAGEVLRDTG